MKAMFDGKAVEEPKKDPAPVQDRELQNQSPAVPVGRGGKRNRNRNRQN